MNPRAAFTTYTLSRGASSANLSTSPNLVFIKFTVNKKSGGEAEIRTLGAFASLVFKTSSLNHSDTSPNMHFLTRLDYYITSNTICQAFFKLFLYF